MCSSFHRIILCLSDLPLSKPPRQRINSRLGPVITCHTWTLYKDSLINIPKTGKQFWVWRVFFWENACSEVKRHEIILYEFKLCYVRSLQIIFLRLKWCSNALTYRFIEGRAGEGGREGVLWQGSRTEKIEDHGYNNFVFLNHENKQVRYTCSNTRRKKNRKRLSQLPPQNRRIE